MSDTAIQRLARSRARTLRRSVGDQLHDLREERALSMRELAGAAGVAASVVSRIESGDANATVDVLARLATALGTEASLRLYAATGPRLRDHLQVRLIEALLAILDSRWIPHLEVPVYRPVRGVIDLVLADRSARELVSGEAHSEIRRAERQLRWASEKTDALASADGWPWMEGSPRTSRILLLRSTPATRAIVGSAPHVFSTAYPGRTADAIAALTGASGTFSGAAIIWVDVRGSASRVLLGPPRGIAIGR
jgi:transcriptional regulator with XRE-family HTH domain